MRCANLRRTQSAHRGLTELSDWTKLATAENPVEAGFLRGLVEAAGIDVQVRSMELWTAAVEIYFSEGARPSIWVPRKDLLAARAALEDRDRGDSAWTCAGCGERLEGQFTACWQCGRAREAGE